MTERKIKIHKETTITAKGEHHSRRSKTTVCLTNGNTFPSMIDAATYAEIDPSDMCKYLNRKFETDGDDIKFKAIKGKVYRYLSELVENPELYIKFIKALSDKANKWDEQEAEREAAQRAEEEARLAEEKRNADIEKARKKWERRKEIRQRKEEEQAKAKALEIEAYDEYIALVGNASESEVATA